MLFQISRRRKSAFAALLLGAASALPGTALAQSFVRIDTITPTRFSMMDGTLQGTISGYADAPSAVNLFVDPGHGAIGGWKVSPGRFTPGDFRFPLTMSLHSIERNGQPNFFISPSEDGTHLPSPKVVYAKRIELPAPAITSATSGRRSVTLHGTALPGAHVELTVAGQSQRVASSGPTGDWSHTFSEVPGGTHLATARVVDTLNTFPASAWVSREVQAEGDILRPLAITAPAPGFPVDRKLVARGVATPERGPVRVSVGGGAVVEATVNPSNHAWTAYVQSPVHGTVVLQASLPGTGEQVRQNVQVAPFGALRAERLVLHVLPGQTRLFTDGTVAPDSPDLQVQYLAQDRSWRALTSIDEAGNWDYRGAVPQDMALASGEVDGDRYAQLAWLTLPSLGSGLGDAVAVPLLRAGPELTSPLTVTPTTTLQGIDPSGITGAVVLTLPDGRTPSAQPDSDGRWSIPVTGLPAGRLSIELRKVEWPGIPVETSRYVLEVRP
ncbi:hypothetical protein C1924_03075 [Stenotrophomonas sp. ESTM1D_MKCIP4_1]|uniref:hypothetical protein n=1 Tax=Stenotrophomonas sp. ESTM1D_MKCIP4_1 TaxID=2072414 RepID=UPI000D53DDE5|nr:hypothetical protein [Stenotrophomonas sp. ESTM1D_MKCIP4_1]AWH52243.1 hypothetical protein C1924_03075 [Stenotrophomonas sp. ESTM1D_MKCIP4_1]